MKSKKWNLEIANNLKIIIIHFEEIMLYIIMIYTCYQNLLKVFYNPDMVFDKYKWKIGTTD